MDVTSALMAYDKLAEAVDPGEGVLDNPSVYAHLPAGLDAAHGCANCRSAAAVGLRQCQWSQAIAKQSPCGVGREADWWSA